MTNETDNLAEMKNKLLSVNVNDENTALNLLVSFINLAQRRGVYSIDESAKI
jgi:hypothetical protein